MQQNTAETLYFHEYFSDWIKIYKQGAVRQATFQKYQLTLKRLVELAPNLRICELDRRKYQTLLNDYAETHERQTTMDFHHQLKGAVLDAVDEGLLKSDPTRKVIIKGKEPAPKKTKFLSQFQLQALLQNLAYGDEPNWDWFILLVAKTGMGICGFYPCCGYGCSHPLFLECLKLGNSGQIILVANGFDGFTNHPILQHFYGLPQPTAQGG